MRQQRDQMPFSLLSVTSNPVGGRDAQVDWLTLSRGGEYLFTRRRRNLALEHFLDVGRQRDPA